MAKMAKLKIYSVKRLLYFQKRSERPHPHPITMSLTISSLNRRKEVISYMREDHVGNEDVQSRCVKFEIEYNIIHKELSEFKDGNIPPEFTSKLRDFDDRLIEYKISLLE